MAYVLIILISEHSQGSALDIFPKDDTMGGETATGGDEMPLLAINLSDKLFLQIKELVERGSYQSFEGFLEVAAYNQLALERGASPAEVISQGHRQVREREARDDPQDGAAVLKTPRAPRGKGKGRKGAKRAAKRGRPAPTARQVFVLDKAGPAEDAAAILKPFALVPAPAAGPRPCDDVAADGDEGEHIFGQVNRLFPLKIACRWLAAWTFSQAAAEWPVFSAISDSLGDDAGKLGTLLEQRDVAAGHKRDDQLATGLPRRGNSASRDRFLGQFLARVNRGGEAQPGAACHYGLAAFQGDRLALTHQGLAFAQLKSSILDGSDGAGGPEALSQQEADFLLRQVIERVPRESEDMRIVLSAVIDGKVTPGALVSAAQARLPRKWTQSMVLTHVSGLVARLADLRLLRRQWQGRNVRYELGEQQRLDAFLKG
jgi:hypothetical protein